MIEIKNINKSYGNKHILKDISLNIGKSQVIAIIGPSGTGKSTFLRCINYLEKPESGEIRFSDEEVYDFSKITKDQVYNLRQNSSMVFQNYALFKNMTVLENVTLHLTQVKGISEEEAREKAIYYLDRVKLADRVNDYPSSLSGGQQQRVGIARAMAIVPEIMLLDEPTSSLDPELVNGILKLIEDLVRENQTMVIVTHEIEFAKRVADRVIFMYDGKIWEENTSEEIFFKPKTKELIQFLDSVL